MENKKQKSEKSIKRAVAVKYDQGIEVPVVMAKGTGPLAEKIIETANEEKVPVTENLELVDLLGIETVGNQVPEQAWKALAEVFAFILNK